MPSVLDLDFNEASSLDIHLQAFPGRAKARLQMAGPEVLCDDFPAQARLKAFSVPCARRHVVWELQLRLQTALA